MRWATSPPFTQIRFFFSSFTARLRVAATTPATTPWGPSPQPTQEGRLQPRLGARKLPRCCCLFPLAPTPTAAIACTRRHASKVMFFFFFFHFFSDHWRDLFSPHARSSNPHPSTMPCHFHCLIHGHISKYMFFFFFFHFFSDQCCRDLFSPHAGSSNPHLSTVRHPSNLASPAAAIAGTQVKICFFCFFFVPFLTNVTETLFTPHAGSSTPHLSTT